jgi:predicted transcriptional regulator
MPADTRFTIRLSDHLDARLRQAAAERGISSSDLAREAIEESVQQAPHDADMDDILTVLRRRAAAGNLTAAREVLRHERWAMERADRGRPSFGADNSFAALDANDDFARFRPPFDADDY